MGAFENILLGVVAGVITSILLYWFSLILIRIIIPWYQRTTYKGIDVSGEWVGKVTGTENVFWNVTLNITQNAHALVGTMTTVKYIKSIEDRITSMNVSGEVWEGFVSLKCRTVSSKNLSFGSMLLKINDSELRGIQIFRNLSKAGPEIVNMEILLKPSEKNA